jgi:hypothetical protein
MTQEDNEETDQKITLATAIYQQLRSRALLEACPNPDILVNSSGGPAPKMFADIEPGALV